MCKNKIPKCTSRNLSCTLCINYAHFGKKYVHLSTLRFILIITGLKYVKCFLPKCTSRNLSCVSDRNMYISVYFRVFHVQMCTLR